MNKIQFAQTIKQKYPQYANVPDDQLADKVLAKYPQYQSKIDQGEGNWLTGNRTSTAGKVIEGASNLLNLPSYAVGGMLDRVQKDGIQALNPFKNPLGVPAAIEGIRNKSAVMKELPETLGMDPNSLPGMAVGFAGELATPSIPVGKLLGTSKLFSKAGKGLETAGEGLTLRALKPSPSQQRKFLEQTGQKMSSFLSNNPNLIGGGEQASEAVSRVIDDLQTQYNALARSGKQIDPNDFVQALVSKADEIEKADFSIEAKRVADRIREQASYFAERSAKEGGRIPIDVLTDTKSSAYGKAGGAIYDPVSLNAQREIGNVGVDTISKYVPESRPLGQKLRDYKLFQGIAEQQAGLGKGTNLISAFAPSGFGALAGFSTGDNIGEKARNAGIGFLAGKVFTNPRVISAESKLAQGLGKAIQNKNVTNGVSNLLGTGARVGLNQVSQTSRPTLQGTQSLEIPQSPQPSPNYTTPPKPEGLLPPKFKPQPLEYKAPKLNIFKTKPASSKRFRLGEQGGGNPFGAVQSAYKRFGNTVADVADNPQNTFRQAVDRVPGGQMVRQMILPPKAEKDEMVRLLHTPYRTASPEDQRRIADMALNQSMMVGSASPRKVPRIPKPTQGEMAGFIDYVRLKQPFSHQAELAASRIAEKYKLLNKTPKSTRGLANVFDRTLSKLNFR